jgi:hypothetical protein
MSNGAGGYTPLVQILREIGRAFDAQATVAALATVYVALDTMAWLACPVGQQSQTRTDFIAWVDKYLTAEPTSDYHYEGIDVYAARCAVLHTYAAWGPSIAVPIHHGNSAIWTMVRTRKMNPPDSC